MLTSALQGLSFKFGKLFTRSKLMARQKITVGCTKTLFIISMIWHRRHKVREGPSPCCSAAVNQKTACSCLFRSSGHWEMNKMKNFKRRFSLSVPRTETIEENEFTEQINQLNIQRNEGKSTSDTRPHRWQFPVCVFDLIWINDPVFIECILHWVFGLYPDFDYFHKNGGVYAHKMHKKTLMCTFPSHFGIFYLRRCM